MAVNFGRKQGYIKVTESQTAKLVFFCIVRLVFKARQNALILTAFIDQDHFTIWNLSYTEAKSRFILHQNYETMMATQLQQVKDLMTTKVIFAHTNHSFTQLCRLLFELDIHHLPVMDDNHKLVGIVTSNDLLKVYSYQVPLLGTAEEAVINEKFSVAEVMSPDPISIAPEASITEAAQLFRQYKIQSLPVVEGEKIVGIITSQDLIKAISAS